MGTGTAPKLGSGGRGEAASISETPLPHRRVTRGSSPRPSEQPRRRADPACDDVATARSWLGLIDALKHSADVPLKSGAGGYTQAAAPRAGAQRFEDYARAWHAARKAEGIAFAESEIIYLEKYILETNVGTEKAPARFGDLFLGDIRPGHVKAVLLGAKEQGRAKQTVQHIRGTLGRVLRQAVEDEFLADNVVEKVRTPRMIEVKRKRVILTDEEVMQFFGCNDVDLEIRIMGLVARCEGGMRTRDVTAWDWTMIDCKLFASCVVPRTKTGTPQEMQVPEILQAPLRQWWVKAGCPTSGPVFPVTKGQRKGEARHTRGVSFAKRLRRGLRKTGIERAELFTATATSLPVDFHSFRRAFKTALAEADVSNERAMMLSGSSDPRAHARYIMATPEMMRIPEAALPQRSRERDLKGIEVADGGDSSSGTRDSNSRPSAWESESWRFCPRISRGYERRCAA